MSDGPKPTAEDLARDLVADLVLCHQATVGPWQHDHFRGNTLGVSHVELTLMIVSQRAAENGEGMVPIRFEDAAMIAASREGWPAAIRRAAAAEKFKQWVHGWLDAQGVPHDPEPEHTAQHGCRISGRMAFLLKRATDAEQRARDSHDVSVLFNDRIARLETRVVELHALLAQAEVDRDAARKATDSFARRVASQSELLRKRASAPSVGAAIRAHRQALGMTQMQLAEAAGIPQSHVSRLEGGKHVPTAATLARVTAAMGTMLVTDEGQL